MRTTHSLSFYCRSSKVSKKNGLAPIEISLIINGQRVFIQLPRKENPELFKKSIESKKDNSIKQYINEVRIKFNDIELDMMRNNIPLTAESVREYYRSGGVKSTTIDDVWTEYLSIIKNRIGKTMTKMCYDKYISARNTMYEYIDKDTEMTAIRQSDIQNILVNLQSKYKESTVHSIMTKYKTVIINKSA